MESSFEFTTLTQIFDNPNPTIWLVGLGMGLSNIAQIVGLGLGWACQTSDHIKMALWLNAIGPLVKFKVLFTINIRLLVQVDT